MYKSMEKIRELGWQKIMVAVAAIDVVLGILIGVVMGAVPAGIVVGILAGGISAGAIFALNGGEIRGHSKSDKYKKLFMNLPIGFAQAKIINDSMGNPNGYCIEEANERFGSYFNLDTSDFEGKILGESKIDVLQSINAWFMAYNNSGTKEGDFLDVEITMEELGDLSGRFNYELACDIGKRVPRIYYRDGKIVEIKSYLPRE